MLLIIQLNNVKSRFVNLRLCQLKFKPVGVRIYFDYLEEKTHLNRC